MVTVRACSAVLAGWLFVSAALWLHSGPQLFNTLLCGVFVLVFCLLGGRRGNAVVGVWLMMTSFLLPNWHIATVYNHMLVGLGLIALPLLAGRRRLPSSHRRDRLPLTPGNERW
jgi:hypothetical protein